MPTATTTSSREDDINAVGFLWAILWFLVLIFIAWPIGFILAWLYVILLPFSACIPTIKDVSETVLKYVKLPLIVTLFMLEMKPLLGEGARSSHEKLGTDEKNGKTYQSTEDTKD